MRLTLVKLAALCLMSAAAVFGACDELYAGLSDGTLNAVGELSPTLTLLAQRTMPGTIRGVAAGPSSFYVGIKNTVYHYNELGVLLSSAPGTSTTVIRDLAAGYSKVYAGLSDGALNAVAQCTLTLGVIVQKPVAGPVSGVAIGPGGTFFVGIGNTIYKYNDAGASLGHVSGTATTVMRDMAFSGGKLYVSLQDGTLNAVAIVLPNLTVEKQVALSNGVITALAAGVNGEFYTASGNGIYHYNSNGQLLHSRFGTATTKFVDLAYYVTPPATVHPKKPVPVKVTTKGT